MGDGFVGQGVPEDADLPPDSPADGEETPPDDDVADVDGDLQAKDEEGAEDVDDDAGEGDDTGEGASSTPGFDKLKAKYGGDLEALARAYMEQANSMSDLDGRLRDLEQFIQGQQTAKEPEISVEERKQMVAESSDVVDASEDLQSIEADITNEQDSYKEIIKELGKAEKEVARLEGKLEASYDEAKPQVQSELLSARSEHKRLLDSFRNSDRTLKKLGTDFKRAQRRMAKAEKVANAEVDRSLKQQRDDDSSAQEVRTEFARAMVEEAKDRDIATDSKKFKVLFDSIQSRLWAYTQTLPEDADPINITAAVKSLTDEYFEEFGGQSFQAKSKQKRAAAGKGNPPRKEEGASASNKGGKQPVRDAAWWDRRAKQMLGG